MSKERSANIISAVTHPFIWIPLMFLIVGFKEFQFLPDKGLIFLLSLILISLFLFLLFSYKKRVIPDIYLIDRRERRKFIILTSIIVMPILIFTMLFLDIPRVVELMIYLLFINIVIFFLVTRFIKISAHIGVVNSIILGLSLTYGAPFLLLMLLEIPIAWARYTLKHHTILEIILAFIISSILSSIVFIVF